MRAEGEEQRQVAPDGVPTTTHDLPAGIGNTKQVSTTDKRDANNTLRRIGASKKGGDHFVDIEAGNTFSVTVGGNVIGLAANNMYTTGSTQQSGHRELPEVPRCSTQDGEPDDSHVYHNIDSDEAATDKGQRADKDEDAASSYKVQKDGSDLLNNPTYVPGALRQDNKKGKHGYHNAGRNNHSASRDISAASRDNLNDNYQNCRDNRTVICENRTARRDNHTASLNNQNTSFHRCNSGSDNYIAGYDNHRQRVCNQRDDTEQATWEFKPRHIDDQEKIGGCQVGYRLLAGTCILLNHRQLSYKNARKACNNVGARLAMPKTEELDLALRNLVRQEGYYADFWIGLRDKGGFFLKERHWLWEDGSTLGHYKMRKRGKRLVLPLLVVLAISMYLMGTGSRKDAPSESGHRVIEELIALPSEDLQEAFLAAADENAPLYGYDKDKGQLELIANSRHTRDILSTDEAQDREILSDTMANGAKEESLVDKEVRNEDLLLPNDLNEAVQAAAAEDTSPYIQQALRAAQPDDVSPYIQQALQAAEPDDAYVMDKRFLPAIAGLAGKLLCTYF
uniref:C-type lectin domain-containing protein n=1 Tax=Branchiostoma floridae TaxID=7739 RepID=C3YYN1_BRAFL|eukprot:XP_002598659.1 hypothetical protein BRAFLDRAFT_67060 [Branchiostoma floridae]